MASAARDATAPAPDRESDPVAGLVAGLYLGFLATPVAVTAVDLLLSPGPAATYGVFLAVVVAAVAASWPSVGRRPSLVARLGATRWRLALPVVGAAVAVVPWFTHLFPSGDLVLVWFFMGMGVMLAGFVLSTLAGSRYAAAVMNAEPATATWAASWPEPARTRLEWLAVVLMFSGAAVWFGGLWLSDGLLWVPGLVSVNVATVAMNVVGDRTFTATPAGLVVRRPPVSGAVHEWSAFDGFSVGDDAIRLHRPQRIDYRCGRSDLEDADAVVAALERHLDRRDAAGD